MYKRVSALAAGAAATLVVGIAVVMVPPASAAEPLSCGSTVTRSTVLTKDLTCPADSPIIIGADDVTLNLGGHILSATINAGGRSGIHVTRGTIRGGALTIDSALRTVVDFVSFLSTQVKFRGGDQMTLSNDSFNSGGLSLSTMRHTLIDHVSVSGVTVALGQDSNYSTIRYSTIRNSGGSGISTNEWSYGVVEHNVLTGNSLAAFSTRDAPDHLILRDNIISGNGAGVTIDFLFGGGNVIAHNVITNNTGSGIDIYPPFGGFGGATDPVQITNNLLSANGAAGLHVKSLPLTPLPVSAGIVVRDNYATSNGYRSTSGAPGDGITIDLPQSGPLPISGNHALLNAGHGINAPGATDGGGNVAAGNRVPPPCIGVVCAGPLSSQL